MNPMNIMYRLTNNTDEPLEINCKGAIFTIKPKKTAQINEPILNNLKNDDKYIDYFQEDEEGNSKIGVEKVK